MADGPRILIVDDDPGIRRLLRVLLRGEGYEVIEASGGRSGVDVAQNTRPDLVILDLGLPDQDGIDLLTHFRSWSRAPVLILSVREQEEQKIAALDGGADDYLTKPFAVGELKARLRALLRRVHPTQSDEAVQIGDLAIDLAHRQVMIRGDPIHLTPTEYDILKVLLQAAGRIVTTQQLLRQVWGPSHGADAHALHVNISNLRTKLEMDSVPSVIVTEPGIGYRLRVE